MRVKLFAVSVAVALSGTAGVCSGQDSVADLSGGDGDALSAYGDQRVRYVLDLVELQSSWSTQFFVGPMLKATRDTDPMFNTLALGASAISPDQLTSVDLGSARNYVRWTTRGAGVAPENTNGVGVSISGYDMQFGVVSSDLNALATNVIGARVGRNDNNLSRLFVERVMLAQSRVASVLDDKGTVTVGSIDADGLAHLRVDGFNGIAPNRIIGENILSVDLPTRSSILLNAVFESGGVNVTQDAGGSSSFAINDGSVTTNTPAALPASIAGSGAPLTLDFSNNYSVGGGAGVTSHLAAPAIEAHRGNPTFSTISTLGGAGSVGALARSVAGGGLVDSLNLTAVASDGSVVDSTAATLPQPLPGHPTLNANGDAQFLQYDSQVSFRGPNGLVAIGLDPNASEIMAAATATDPVAGKFIAVARIAANGAATWFVPAMAGTPVLDGPGGATLGVIMAPAPAGLSAPGMDLLGNVYFVGMWDPTLGSPRTGLFKAVYSGSGYELELLLEEGDTFLGANSASQYTIDALALADSDSLASAAFHAGQVLQPMVPGLETTDPASSLAFGGLLVNAKISYNNQGATEAYEATLFLSPFSVPAPDCVGDVNGDGKTDVFDFGELAANFGAGPGATLAEGDITGDGFVDVFDFAELAADFGCGD